MSEELAALRNRVPGCSVIAFADLSTGMVLASSTCRKTTQEKLEALCAAGREALRGDVARQITEGFGNGAPDGPCVALRAEKSGLTCFIHAPMPAEEALCCVVSSLTPLQDLIDAGTALLIRTASEG